ncbi:MAG: PD-(D/E)XK nuclease family protein [Desulfovibrio sp.]|nr:PD-(D/E)XK nuclease family protein [Desulfovibrio sp.]
MEATEDQLPGLPEGDPLLPDVLRPELGLPPAHTREQTAAYHFFRLLAGAEQALLLWQENPEAPGLQDGRKKKSRFVEELLWREECRRKRLLASHGRDGPLLVLENSVAPPALRSSAIPVVPALRALVRKLLDRPVSASLLDAYLRCPRQFFHERLVRLAPVAEVAEGEDPPATGRLLHAALQEYYTSLLGADLPAGKDLSPKRLRLAHQALLAAFRGQPDYADLRRRLPADAFAMLDAAADIRLLHYIQSQPATRPLALEIPLAASFPFQDSALTLAGAADRLDLRPFIPARGGREGLGLHILDYKTGRPAAPARDLWRDSSLWSRLDSWRPEEGNALLNELADRLRSVQLPLYLLLFSLARSQGGLPPPLDALPDPDDLDAAWIPLGQGGEETALFASRMSPDERQEIIQKRIPALVRFLLRHLTEISGFSPRPGPHCDWCFSRTLCTLR